MSLIVGLAGKDEIVVAADTLGFVGDAGGFYGFECRKLHVIQEKWLLGVAGTSIGWDLFSAMNQQHLELGKGFHKAVWDFSNEMHELYQGQDYEGETFLLLCGIHDGRPLLAEWSFPRKDGVSFPTLWTAIGAKHHGALYFASSRHSRDMDTELRILLAYFCVREAAACDLRVRAPIEVAVVRENGVRCFSEEQLGDVERRSEEIVAQIAGAFHGPAPAIPGLK